MTRSPTDIIARSFHDNDKAYAPPYWDDCYPEMQRFYLEMADKALAALAGEGWTLVRQAVTIRYCTLHESEAADSEDPRVCWLYDGGGDCEFVRYRLVPVEGEN